jgi:hypothetical protein
MFFGFIIFAVLAILCIFAGAVAMKRSRDYGRSDDDFDFDAYEGFDKD